MTRQLRSALHAPARQEELRGLLIDRCWASTLRLGGSSLDASGLPLLIRFSFSFSEVYSGGLLNH
jgi:hypothetical protein